MSIRMEMKEIWLNINISAKTFCKRVTSYGVIENQPLESYYAYITDETCLQVLPEILKRSNEWIIDDSIYIVMTITRMYRE